MDISERGAGAGAGASRSGRPVVLVTGSTDGLGREVAMRLAGLGANVLVHGRRRELGDALVAAIEGEGKGSGALYVADLASLAEVRRLAEAILRDHDRLDVLVNNAGIWLAKGDRRLSPDGHELTFAVNYLASFLLTRLLLPRLVESAPSRIVNVASAAQMPLDFEDVMLTNRYSGGRAYGQSKLAQVMDTFELAGQLESGKVTVNALHPATFMDTGMVRGAGIRPQSSVASGAEAVVRLVVDADVGSGQFFNGVRAARAHAQAYDAEARRRLRDLSGHLTGVDGLP